MIVIVDVGVNQNIKGLDKYLKELDNSCNYINGLIPEVILYKDGISDDDIVGKIVLVKDDFSFGRGGCMRKQTMNIICRLFVANRNHMSFILLEPSSKLDNIVESSADIKMKLNSFKRYSDLIIGQLRKDTNIVYEEK
jgi:hypothetical protein